MIHNESTINFTDKYNTIVGVNGSGKSAFIEGLQFLVNGSKERFKSWKDYISYNETECEVKVEISQNESIIEISRKGKKRNNALRSLYFINNKKSNLEKVRRKFLDLGIDLLNPLVTVKQHQISFLVREFSPNSIFRYIENSSNLAVQKEKMLKINETMENNKNRIGELKDKLSIAEWNLKELKNQHEEDQQYFTNENKLEKLKTDLLYFSYIEKKTSLESTEELIVKEQTSIEENNKSISDLENEINSLNDDIEQLNKQKETLLEDKEKIEEENSTLNLEVSEYNKEFRENISQIGRKIDLKNIKTSYLDLKSKLEEQEISLSTISKEIEPFEFDDNDINQNQILNKELEQLKSILDNKRVIILPLIKEMTNIEKLDKSFDSDNYKEYFNKIENNEDIPIDTAKLNEIKKSVELQFQNADKERKNLQSFLNQTIKELEEIQTKIKKIESNGKKGSYPLKLLDFMKTLNEKNIRFLGPICDDIQFTSKEIENGFRHLVSNRIWYSLIFFSREDQKLARSLKPKTNEFSIILQTNTPHIPKMDLNGINLQYGRLIDGVECNKEAKGYLYEIVGNTILTSDFSESNTLSQLKLKTITLEGISVNPGSFYETDIQRKKSEISFNEFQTRNELETYKDSFNEIKTKNDELSKKLNSIHASYKNLKNQFENITKLVDISKSYNQALYEYREKLTSLEKVNPLIKSYIELKDDLESLNKSIIQNKNTIGIFEILIELEDEISQRTNKLKENASKLKTLNSSLSDLNDQLSKKNISEIREKMMVLENQNKLILERIKNYENRINQLKDEIDILRDKFDVNCKPELQLNEIMETIEKLERKIRYLRPPIRDLGVKIENESNKVISIKTRINNEETKITKLNSKITNFLNEWKTAMNNLTMKVENNSKMILKDTTLEIKLKFQESKENNIEIFDNSTIKLSILKNGVSTSATSLSGGESGLIAMSIILALIDEIPTGGVRILDEFDVHLDRIRTIFMRDQILKRSQNSQYLVFTPGKFPELSKGSNIIRLSIIDNKPKIISGWDILQEA